MNKHLSFNTITLVPKKIFLIILCTILLNFCSSSTSPEPENPDSTLTAEIEITVDQEPILMRWNPQTEMWRMTPLATITEKNGVGVDITTGRFEFVLGDVGNHEPQEISGLRIEANATFTTVFDLSTANRYDKVKVTISGTDDNNHAINVSFEFNLQYVEPAR